MHKKLVVAVVLGLIVAGLTATSVFASIATVGGSVTEISAPLSVKVGELRSNTEIFAFAEKQGVTLGTDLNVDLRPYPLSGPGSIPAGTTVDSHYIHFDPSTTTSLSGSVTFSNPILGVIVRTSLLPVSDATLGATGTDYAGTTGARGSRDGDTVTISIDGLTVTVNLTAVNTGRDDIRVVTISSEKVDVCHRTRSRKNPERTINISSDSVEDHLAHGDRIGAC